MKHPIDFSPITIILIAFVRNSYTSNCCGKVELTREVGGTKIRELIEFTASDQRNGKITKNLFRDVKREIIFVEPTVSKLIRKADKFFSNEIVENSISLALAIADLNPALAISIDVIKIIVAIIKEAREGRQLSLIKKTELEKKLHEIAIASVTTFPKKVKTRLDRDRKNFRKIVQITKSEGNGAIARDLCRSAAVWMESEVEEVVRLADKVYSNPVVADVDQLILDVAALQKSNEVAVDLVQAASAILEAIKKAILNGKSPTKEDLNALKKKIHEIGKRNAQIYEVRPDSHPWEKVKQRFDGKKERARVLVDIGESDKGLLCRILLNNLKAKVISVERAVKDLIIKTENFLDNPIIENLFELALHIAEINPYVDIAVASIKLVIAIIKEIKKQLKRHQLNPNGELLNLQNAVIDTASRLAAVKIGKDGSPGRNVIERSYSSPSRGLGTQVPPYAALAPSTLTPTKSRSADPMQPPRSQASPPIGMQLRRQTTEKGSPNSMKSLDQGRLKSAEPRLKAPTQRPVSGSNISSGSMLQGSTSYGTTSGKSAVNVPTQLSAANAQRGSASRQERPQIRAPQGMSTKGSSLVNSPRGLSAMQQRALGSSQSGAGEAQRGANNKRDGSLRPRFNG